MQRIKKLQAAHYIGSILCILGFLNKQFMIIRPNRIENGKGISLLKSLDGNILFFATVFLILLFISGYLYLCICDTNTIVLELVLLIASVALYLFVTGSVATAAIVDMGTAARVSLGLGFWLLLIGIILFLWQSVKRSNRSSIWVLISCISIVILLYWFGIIKDISIIREFSDKSERIYGELITHMQLTLGASLTGFVFSVGLSYLAYRIRRFEGLVAALSNFAQVVPTLSLLGLLMIPLAAIATSFPLLKSMGVSGIGFFPAYIVLTLYTLLPITSNTLSGFKMIPQSIIEASQAMGMNHAQMLVRVELPIALPAIFMGFRIALVQTVGNCILAGLVGGGGLGTILFLGLAQSAPDLVIVSSLLVVTIAVFFEVVLTNIEKYIKKTVRGELNYD